MRAGRQLPQYRYYNLDRQARSNTCNFIEKPIFLCNSNPEAFGWVIVDALDGLATQGKTQMKMKFFGDLD